MADRGDGDRLGAIIDGVQRPVVAHSDSVRVAALELLYARRAGIIREHRDSALDAGADFAGEGFQLAGGTRQKLDTSGNRELRGCAFAPELIPGDALVTGLAKCLVYFDEIESVFDYVGKLLARGVCLSDGVWWKGIVEQSIDPPQHLAQRVHDLAKLGRGGRHQPSSSVTVRRSPCVLA